MRPAGECGQSTVELALCLPVMLLVIACALDVGELAVTQTRLWHAAREGARMAAVSSERGAIARAVAEAGAEGAQVITAPRPEFRVQGGPVTVVVRRRASARVPLLRPLFRGITLRARATFRVEQP